MRMSVRVCFCLRVRAWRGCVCVFKFRKLKRCDSLYKIYFANFNVVVSFENSTGILLFLNERMTTCLTLKKVVVLRKQAKCTLYYTFKHKAHFNTSVVYLFCCFVLFVFPEQYDFIVK